MFSRKDAKTQRWRDEFSGTLASWRLGVILCLLVGGWAWGATVIGNLRDVTGNALSPAPRFVPLSTPLQNGTNTVLDVVATARATNGFFSIWLEGGWYRTEFGPYGKAVNIAVPAEDGVYQFNYCASLATNLPAFSGTNLVTAGMLGGVAGLDGRATNLTIVRVDGRVMFRVGADGSVQLGLDRLDAAQSYWLVGITDTNLGTMGIPASAVITNLAVLSGLTLGGVTKTNWDTTATNVVLTGTNGLSWRVTVGDAGELGTEAVE